MCIFNCFEVNLAIDSDQKEAPMILWKWIDKKIIWNGSRIEGSEKYVGEKFLLYQVFVSIKKFANIRRDTKTKNKCNFNLMNELRKRNYQSNILKYEMSK